MTFDNVRWALKQDVPDGEKAVLAAVALAADAQGVTFAGQRYLAAMLSRTDRTVRANLAKLGERGLITRYRRHREDGSRTSDLIVLGTPRSAIDLTVYSGIVGEKEGGDQVAPGSGLPGGQAEAGPQTTRNGASGGTDRPGELPALTQERASALFDAPEEKLPKFNGKPVKREHWRLAQDVLTAFNEAADRSLAPLTSSGHMSENVKLIYGRILLWPDLSLERHREIIRRTIASKWWWARTPNTPPEINVVYGPKVFERNMDLPENPVPPAPARGEGRRERTAKRMERAQRALESRS